MGEYENSMYYFLKIFCESETILKNKSYTKQQQKSKHQMALAEAALAIKSMTVLDCNSKKKINILESTLMKTNKNINVETMVKKEHSHLNTTIIVAGGMDH